MFKIRVILHETQIQLQPFTQDNIILKMSTYYKVNYILLRSKIFITNIFRYDEYLIKCKLLI